MKDAVYPSGSAERKGSGGADQYSAPPSLDITERFNKIWYGQRRLTTDYS